MSRCRRALKVYIRGEPSFSKDPLLLEALVILTSDFLKQHRLLDKLAGLALVLSYDLCTNMMFEHQPKVPATFRVGSEKLVSRTWEEPTRKGFSISTSEMMDAGWSPDIDA